MEHGSSSGNRMREEHSPYLLQHANQPIWWQPWGEAAFARAQAEHKLVFLSIGYAACHWCHVMAHETFEDAEVAALLNAEFVAIKVDRQERPDVDAVYMTLCEAMTGSGGWPLTVVLTPDRKPLFAGTYFPPRNGMRGEGLLDILLALNAVWHRDEAHCTAQAQRVVEAVSQAMEVSQDAPSQQWIDAVHEALVSVYDTESGGFGRSPKFPRPCSLLFLLREAEARREDADNMLHHTLNRMARGGIYDQIGGGFMRYAVDRKWLVPHYEKMLGENALLALVYARAYRQSGLQRDADTVRHIFDWALRDMLLPEGGFASAQDADSAEGEGAFYLWTPEAVNAVLGETRGETICSYLNIKEGGSLPHIALRARAPEDLPELLTALRQARAQRPAPALDDQMLTAWNAWMVLALSHASTVLNDTAYLEQAQRTAECIQTRMMDADGRLFVSYRDGKAQGDGTLAEYAAWSLALCALYDATWDGKYLDLAVMTARRMVERFGDSKSAGLFQTAQGGESMIMRLKPSGDDPLPGPNAAAAWALAHLAALGADDLRPWADRTLSYVSGAMRSQPHDHAFGALALIRSLWPHAQLDVAPGQGLDLGRLRSLLRTRPEVTVLFGDTRAPSFARDALRAYEPMEGKTAYYLCVGKRCLQPLDSLDGLAERLDAFFSTAEPGDPLI